MSREEVEKLIQQYGVRHILKQFNLDIVEVLSLLDMLGYIYLDSFNGVEDYGQVELYEPI